MFAALLVAAALGPPPAPRVVSAAPAADLDARFARDPKWTGGDGIYSLPAGPGRVLWLFSDTWVGGVKAGRRVGAKLVNNTVGVQTPDSVAFHWNKGADGKPAAVFPPGDGRGWVWPFAGVLDGGRAWVFLMQQEHAPGSEAFGFKSAGVWLAEVANPLDPPADWRITQRKFPHTLLGDDRRILFGSATLTHGGFVYVYGVDERPRTRGFGRRMLLARVPVGSVRDFDRWQFLSADGWSPDVRRATPLAPGVASEFSVTPAPGGTGFLLVTHDELLSPAVVARSARDPWGPWSPKVELFRCPEPARARGTFAYAGKAHPHLAAPGEIVFSYAVNAFKMAAVLADDRLYRPRFVRVSLR